MLTEEVGGPALCWTSASGVLAAATLDMLLLCAGLSGLARLTMQGSLGVGGESLTSLRMGERIVCLTNTRIILNITRSHVHFSFCNWTRMSSVVSWWGKFCIKGPCSYFPVRPSEK